MNDMLASIVDDPPRGRALRRSVAGEDIVFGDLIDPLPVKEFLNQYWEQCPLVSRGLAGECFSSLFCLKDVDRAITFFRPRPGRIDLVTDQGFVRENFLNSDGTASVSLVLESYRKGSTIVLSGMHETWEPLVGLSGRLEAELNHPVTTSVYVTPPNTQGVAPHYDTQENFLLQVEGSKLWSVYPPVRDLPPVEGSYAPVPADKLGEPLCVERLEPGDVLYVPRGFVHQGVADGVASLHITVDIHVRTWSDFIGDALAGLTERDAQFRRSLPIGLLQDPDREEEVASQFRDMMERFMAGATARDGFVKHGEKLSVRRPPMPDGHFAVLNHEIEASTPVRRRRTTLNRVVEHDGIAMIQFSGNQLVGPAKIGEALHYVASTERFTPSELPGTLNEREKILLVGRLVRVGYLTLD